MSETTKTAIKCPAGTQRSIGKGKELRDCYPCLFGSASSKAGSTTCILCGAGSTNSEDRTTCACNGQFRAWQESTNTCVCEPNYFEPIPTQVSVTNTVDLDCNPILTPVCAP